MADLGKDQGGATPVDLPPMALPIAVLRWVALLFILLKLAFLAFGGMFMDEAYYWLWGQHPALSYYDHPSMIGWTQWLSSAVFGWNTLALRAMVGLTLIGDIVVLSLISKRLAGAQWQRHFWPVLVLFLATPMFYTVTGLAIPDHLLTFFTLLAFYGFLSFLTLVDRGEPALRFLYLGALGLGLAVLSKYNGVLVGVGLVVYAASVPRFRVLFKSVHTYLAMALVLVIQTPVVIWNLSENLASFGFILGGRHAGLTSDWALSGLVGYIGSQLAFLSPVGIVAFGLFAFRRAQSPGQGLARTVFWISTPLILAVAAMTDVLFHWNLVGYLVVLPFLGAVLTNRWAFLAHLIYGAGFAGLMLFNFTAGPVMRLISYADRTTILTYDWDQTAELVEGFAREHDAGFVASVGYEPTSPLAFEVRDLEVTSLSRKREQFDYWFDRAAHAGQSAILVDYSYRPLPKDVRAQFETVTELDEQTLRRFGKRIDYRKIYLGTGFKP